MTTTPPSPDDTTATEDIITQLSTCPRSRLSNDTSSKDNDKEFHEIDLTDTSRSNTSKDNPTTPPSRTSTIETNDEESPTNKITTPSRRLFDPAIPTPDEPDENDHHHEQSYDQEDDESNEDDEDEIISWDNESETSYKPIEDQEDEDIPMNQRQGGKRLAEEVRQLKRDFQVEIEELTQGYRPSRPRLNGSTPTKDCNNDNPDEMEIDEERPNVPHDTTENDADDENSRQNDNNSAVTGNTGESESPAINDKQTPKDNQSQNANPLLTHPDLTTMVRFPVQIDIPVSDEPVQHFVLMLQHLLQYVQQECGESVSIGPWDPEHTDTKIITKPAEIPDGKNGYRVFHDYFATYINLKKQESRTVWLKVRFITNTPSNLTFPLLELGQRCHDCLKEQHQIRVSKNPCTCQATKSTTLGWLSGSTKSISEKTFIPAIREALEIPDYIPIGIQWRTIKNEFGRNYAWSNDAPNPPQALHIEVEENFALRLADPAASLWRRGATKRVLGLQLRLVPCFSSPRSKGMSTKERTNTLLMASKQQFFTNEWAVRLPPNELIMNLDSPVSSTDPRTLRQYILSKAPTSNPVARLFVSVDKQWNGNACIFVTVKPFVNEAYQALAAMIPECLHEYGKDAESWFTNAGLAAYTGVVWDPKTKSSSCSIRDIHSQDCVDEDFFGMGQDWNQNNEATDQRSVPPSSDNNKETNSTTPTEGTAKENNRNETSGTNNESNSETPTEVLAPVENDNQPSKTPTPNEPVSQQESHSTTVQAVLANRANFTDVASLGSVYQRNKDDDTTDPNDHQANADNSAPKAHLTPSIIETIGRKGILKFSNVPTNPKDDQTNPDDPSKDSASLALTSCDQHSQSTMGQTTEGTRIRLHDERAKTRSLEKQIIEMQAQIDRQNNDESSIVTTRTTVSTKEKVAQQEEVIRNLVEQVATLTKPSAQASPSSAINTATANTDADGVGGEENIGDGGGHQLSHWGQSLQTRNSNAFRVAFQNLNGLINSSTEKDERVHSLLHEHRIDFLGVQEININFNITLPSKQWKPRHQAFQGFTHASYNRHSTCQNARLFGGTGCFLTRSTHHRAISHGQDSSGLGRWTWSVIRGKQGIQTRIISAYRPNRDHTNHPFSVFSQHELYFRQQGVSRDPCYAFFEDLDVLINEWLEQGDQIILGGDFNDNVLEPRITLWLTKWNLVNGHLALFPNLRLVDTCNKSTQERFKPIDTIWVSRGLSVVGGGMSGFGECDLGSTDHRLLWLDIDHQSIFGFVPPQATARPLDCLPLHDPTAIRRYNNYVYRERQRHQLPVKLFALEQYALQSCFTTEHLQQYESLHSLDYGIRMQARKKCRRFFAGKVQFSDVIDNDRREIHLWLLVVQKLRRKNMDTRKIRRLMHSTGQGQALRLTLPEALDAQKACRARYKTHKKDHLLLREKHELHLIEQQAKYRNITVAQQQKMRRNARIQKQTHKRIRQIMNKKDKNSLSMVEYDNSFQETIQCFSQHDIEQACFREGQRRFSQSDKTPFLRGSLLQDLGYLGEQQYIDQILHQTYSCGEDVDEYTKKFIEELGHADPSGKWTPINGYSTTTQHIQGWSKMRYYTASSPFGPLFADYIAGTKDRRVAEVDAAFSSIPALTGWSPKSWIKALDVMIPKKKTSVHVSKLRIIVLFHAMFNMLNKSIGRQMVHRADELKAIPPEAYGSRPGKRAITCALNKVLTNDVLRQKRQQAVFCSNDAVSCYDRIVHSVAAICMQRLGVTRETCDFMFGTLQQLEHYVATAYGTSAQHYGAVHIPLQGIGQGNGAGPSIWLVISIPIINMLKKQGFGFRSITPITKQCYTFPCFTFVDDTDIIHVPDTRTSQTSHVIKEMQNMLDHWEGGIQASGGGLSHEKSYWTFIDFKWNTRTLKWQYKDIEETPGTLTIKGLQTNGRVQVQRISTSTAKETLGCWIACDGNPQAQKQVVADRIADWSDRIRCRQLGVNDAWVSLRMGLRPSARYPLAVARFSITDCNDLMRPLIKAGLKALNFPFSFPRALVFAPRDYLGLGFPNLWTDMNFDKISLLLDYGATPLPDITGGLFRDMVESFKLELGLPGSPFTHNYYKLHLCSTDTWFLEVWKFLTDNNLQLQIGLANQTCPRQNDCWIMQRFLDKNVPAKILKILNLCRMFSRVVFLSDLCRGDGTRINLDLLNGNTQCENHPWEWPLVVKPTRAHWAVWKTEIKRCFVAPHTQDTVHPALGSWSYVPEGWPFLYSASTNSIYHREDQAFVRYQCLSTGHRIRFPTFTRTQELGGCPLDAVPTTISSNSRSRRSPQAVRHQGFTKIDNHLSDNDCNWWGRTVINEPTNLHALINGIRTGTAVAVTDGSFLDQMGTAAYICKADLFQRDRFECVNMTPGKPEEIDAYRAELGGIYGIIETINMLARQFDIYDGKVTIGCDCSSALNNVFDKSFCAPKQAHHDMVSGIRRAIQESPVQWEWRHIRGHQDKHTSFCNLDPWEQLNVEMDDLAKTYWRVLNQQRPTPFSLPARRDEWSLWSGKYRFPSWDESHAHEHIYNKTINAYWSSKLQSEVALQQFHWPASCLAYKQLPSSQQLWIPKWLTSFLPIGKNLARWNAQNTPVCPRCGDDEDHRFHVIRCPHHEAATIWTDNISSLNLWLERQATHPGIRDTICNMLSSWYDQSEWEPNTRHSQPVQAAASIQHSLGPSCLVDGHLTPQWAALQDIHFKYLGRRTTGKRWASRLIRRIWQIPWSLWRHRHKHLLHPDSANLAARNDLVNRRIMAAYNYYYTHPEHNPSRWFIKPQNQLKTETWDFKVQWMEHVEALFEQVFTTNTDDTPNMH